MLRENSLLSVETGKLRASGTSLKHALFWRKQRSSKPQMEFILNKLAIKLVELV